jgi:hypothetical protein
MHPIFKQLIWTGSIGVLLNLFVIFPTENHVRNNSRLLREKNLPDRRLFYKSSELVDAFNSLSDDAQRKYFIYLVFDSVYALIYPFFCITAIQIIVGFLTHGRYKFVVLETLPLMEAFADLIENFILMVLLFYFPQRIVALEIAIGWITWFKHVLAGIVTMTITVGTMTLTFKIIISRVMTSSFSKQTQKSISHNNTTQTKEQPTNTSSSKDKEINSGTSCTQPEQNNNQKLLQKETTDSPST